MSDADPLYGDSGPWTESMPDGSCAIYLDRMPLEIREIVAAAIDAAQKVEAFADRLSDDIAATTDEIMVMATALMAGAKRIDMDLTTMVAVAGMMACTNGAPRLNYDQVQTIFSDAVDAVLDLD